MMDMGNFNRSLLYIGSIDEDPTFRWDHNNGILYIKGHERFDKLILEAFGYTDVRSIDEHPEFKCIPTANDRLTQAQEKIASLEADKDRLSEERDEWKRKYEASHRCYVETEMVNTSLGAENERLKRVVGDVRELTKGAGWGKSYDNLVRIYNQVKALALLNENETETSDGQEK